MYNKIFKRVEIKYILTDNEKNKLLKRIKPFIEKDEYYESTINNVYYDTPNNDLIVNSIEKPLFKEKVRIRSYGTPNNESKIFLEIKNKYKGVVGKRRVSLSLNEFYDFINNRNYDESNQIMKEIVYHFDYYNLVPKMFIAYDRKSYKGKDDDSVRITVDSNLRSRNDNLKLECGSQGKNYFDNPKSIVEIKILGSMPLWLSNILSELKIYPRSFSKYGSIYQKESGVKC